MTVYVYRDGKLVEKEKTAPEAYRFKEYTSPITGAVITSPRQRERDLNGSNSYDPRDTPAEFRRAKEHRDQANAGSTGHQLDFWK